MDVELYVIHFLKSFYVAGFEFKGLEPYFALCNHGYKNKIWSHSKSSHSVMCV